jgi:hypothetical protein
MSGKMRTQRGAADPARGACEPSDLDFRSSMLTLLGLLGLVALVCLGVAGLFALLGGLRQPDAPLPRTARGAPALQVNEARDRAVVDAHAKTQLHAGNGRPGIADAMRRTAAVGWDAPR